MTRFGSRSRPHRVQSPVTWECPDCHKQRGLQHTCGNRGDFKRRRRKQETTDRRRKRKERNARIRAERKVRDGARKKSAKARTGPARPRAASHEPGTCGDRACPKYGCVAHWQGWEEGYGVGHADGMADGYAAGSAS